MEYCKRRSILKEIETALLDSIEAKDSKKKGGLFLIGMQHQEDPAIFTVTDHRLIYCIIDEVIYSQVS